MFFVQIKNISTNIFIFYLDFIFIKKLIIELFNYNFKIIIQIFYDLITIFNFCIVTKKL